MTASLRPDLAPPWLRPLLDGARDLQPGQIGERRLVPPDGGGGRRASVLIAFGEGPHGPDTLLVERAATLREHAGQVAFPGGGADATDADAVATALREAEEETGLDPAGVVPLAQLPDLYIPPSGFVVAPIVAHWARPVPVHAVDAGETATVARVPLSELADPANRFTREPSGGLPGPGFRRVRAARVGFHRGIARRDVGSGRVGAPVGHHGRPHARRRVALGEADSSGGRHFMSWVDLVVIGLALIAGVSGWRHGMAVAALSFVGVLGGAIIGVRIAPLLAAGIDNQTTRIVVSIAVVVLLVALGETTGVYFGRRIRDRITGERVLAVDSTLGSILQAITVVLAAWLVALPLASASFPALASGVRGSEVLRAVDGVMPEGAKQLPDDLRKLLDNSGFPDVLSPFAETPITEIGPPNLALAESPAIDLVGDSVLKVRAKAPSCQRQMEGTGFIIGPRLVMTNAHVVAGSASALVEASSGNLSAEVVYYDPRVDLAVLRVNRALGADPLAFEPVPAKAGDDAIVLGYPLDGAFKVTPARVRQSIKLKGPDIYESGEVIRDVYTVRAKVQSGNSGGPMIDPTGKVTGVVFGAAVDDQETGFVLSVDQVTPAVQKALGLGNSPAEVDTGSCAA